MIPLAARMRPETLADFVGQKHLVEPGKPIHTALEKKHLFSFILWGPPGVGKTTLARIYAHAVGAEFFELSAVSAGKEDIRKILEKRARGCSLFPVVLFIDEIHRFNKAQQDFLLPFVESGELTFIGATTENPSFEIISPLLSRCQVFTLSELTHEELKVVIQKTNISVDAESLEWLVQFSNGDARQALVLLETTLTLYSSVSVKNLENAAQQKHLRYDKKAEEHYNTISAFIKSMRSSQPDAALYYLARMVEAGEDPKFIARRLVIFASEDVGLADPTALQVANDVFRSVEIIGYPECAINLAHGTVYLAQAKKNRESYDAYFRAVDEVKRTGNLPIPLIVRNAPTKLMKDLGYKKGYQLYSKEDFLPDALKGKKYLKSSTHDQTSS
jgi:putative ATPase